LPDDCPALGPNDLLCARGAPGKYFHSEAFASAKELQRDAKAEDAVLARPQGERGVSAPKGADAVVDGGLCLFGLAFEANGNAHENEAAVGREITRLRPVLLYAENGGLL